ncbi:MAG: 1-deoxy-D-xylulose-5-phosphate reductoisomerase [Bermanella sp.]|jgi:1-deoxy-D-xylulose-5-phosphate reductoisomerase
MRMAREQVTVLGSTGSIGLSTLDVLARQPERFEVYALTANTGVDDLLKQVLAVNPRFAVLRDPEAAGRLKDLLEEVGHSSTEVLAGEENLCRVAADEDVDVVMAAIVGAAGLEPTLAAVDAGKKVLLANKEALVMAGRLFMDAVEKSSAVLLPIDSEHNAIFQCLADGSLRDLPAQGVCKILLTGSGGPFRDVPVEQLESVTPDQACAHPNWSMGRKISVDSATMMNKGLELIEACWLFDTSADKITVVVHPQSIIHSMVEYIDGSVLAQLGNPDMRTPIAHALAWPERMSSGVGSLDLISLGRLDFEAPDDVKFPCLRLAREAVNRGGTAATILNAANEVAVAAFLSGRLPFTGIAQVIESVMQNVDVVEPDSLADVKFADRQAREATEVVLAARIKVR